MNKYRVFATQLCVCTEAEVSVAQVMADVAALEPTRTCTLFKCGDQNVLGVFHTVKLEISLIIPKSIRIQEVEPILVVRGQVPVVVEPSNILVAGL